MAVIFRLNSLSIYLPRGYNTYAGMDYMPHEPKGNGLNIPKELDTHLKAGKQHNNLN